MAPQSYYIGGKIRASDFNNFADDINDIVGLGAGDSGYGQDQLMVSYVSAGARIRVANWNELLTSLRFAAQHQGTAISSPTSTIDPGFPVLREAVKIIPTLIDDIANVRANKLNYDISKMSIDANKISSSRTFVEPTYTNSTDAVDQEENTWISKKYYEFKVTFADADARRNFFNAGGEIRFSCELTGYDVSHPQSDAWASLLDAMNVIRFGHNETVSNSSTNTGSGARYGFTYLLLNDITSYEDGNENAYINPFYKKTGAQGYYAGNQINMYAKLLGDNAISFKIDFDDSYPSGNTDDPDTAYDESTNNHTTGWIDENNTKYHDYVDGTLRVTIDQQRADDNDVSNLGVVSPSPTYSHISEL